MEPICYRCGSVQGSADCPRCVALRRTQCLSQRVAEAIRAHRTVVLAEPVYLGGVSAVSPTFELPAANLLYVGRAEYHELVRDRLHTWPDMQGNVTFMNLRVVRVDLENWLQVARMEGVK